MFQHVAEVHAVDLTCKNVCESKTSAFTIRI